MSSSTTILMIDDDPNARRIVTSLLAAEPYRLIFAADGYEGLAQAAAYVPDGIMSDVIMPGLDGFEACAGRLESVYRGGVGDRQILVDDCHAASRWRLGCATQPV